MKKAPYTERNEADYKEMTERIGGALKRMEDDRRVSATERTLASLAGCSRGTLRNRIYPLEQLKQIKLRRAQDEKKKFSRITLSHRIDVEVHIADKKSLNEQLKKSRDEAAMLADKYFFLEDELKKYRRANEILQKAKSVLEKQVNELKFSRNNP